MMKLYFSPLACSLASRIVIYERELPAQFERVDRHTKRLEDGTDYRDVYGLGLVPAVRTDDGALLTENAAVLQYLWQQPAGGAPRSVADPVGTQRWLSFIGTELHKGIFTPLFDPNAPPEVGSYAMKRGATRLAYVDAHLQDRTHLLEDFGPADAYLYTVLTWTYATEVALADHPNLARYHRRMYDRPSVRKAVDEERQMYEATAS